MSKKSRMMSRVLLCMVGLFLVSYAQTPYRMLIAVTPAADGEVGSLYDWGYNSIPWAHASVARLANVYANSSPDHFPYIMPQIELAGVVKLDYTEVGMATDLNRFRRADDGYMNEVHALRSLYAADIVMLAGVFPDLTIGGKAEGIAVDSTYAFQATSVYYDHQINVAAHENGHLFGCRHNWAQDSTTSPYPYGHGYLHASGWGDVMSYVSTLTLSMPWLSNPYETYLGQPTGTHGTGNCARVHHERKWAVAGFRNPKNKILYTNTLQGGEYAGVVAADSILVSGVSFPVGAEGYFQAPNVVVSSTYTNYGKFTVEGNSIQAGGNFKEGSETYLKASDSALIKTFTLLEVKGKLTIESKTVSNSSMVLFRPGAEGHIIGDSNVFLKGTFSVDSTKFRTEGKHVTTIGAVSLTNKSVGQFIASERVTLNPGFSVRSGSTLHVYVGSSPGGVPKFGADRTAHETRRDASFASTRATSFTSKLRHNSKEVFLEYVLPDERSVQLKIFDLQGKLVSEERLGRQGAGSYSRVIRSPVGTGRIYFLQVQAGMERFNHRFVVQ